MIRDKLHRLGVSALLAACLVLTMVTAVGAQATLAPLTATEVQPITDGLRSALMTVLPYAIGLFIFATSVRLAFKWGRKFIH